MPRDMSKERQTLDISAFGLVLSIHLLNQYADPSMLIQMMGCNARDTLIIRWGGFSLLRGYRAVNTVLRMNGGWLNSLKGLRSKSLPFYMKRVT